MIKMNLELEKLKKKQFQVIPLRTEKVIKNIPIDTKSLIELLVKKVKGDKGEKSKFLLDIEKYKDEIWSRFFNLNKSIFRKKNFDFKYLIYTDCFSVSILFLHKSQTEKNKKINEKKKIGRQDKRKLKKGKTPEEKMKMKQDKKKEADEQKNKKKLERLKQKEEFKKLSKEEKKKITETKRRAKLLEKQQRDEENLRKQEEFNKLPSAERERIKKEEELKIELEKRSQQDEFPYLEDLTELQTEELQKTNWVVNDPGKIRLLKMLSKDGKVFTYTNRQRMRETKRLIYQKKLQNYRQKNRILDIEKELGGYNSKSCKMEEFKKYVIKKNETNGKLFEKYEAKIFRQLKWYTYINTQRSEANLIKKIKEVFGEDCKIIMGDWSVPKQMKNFISTPMIGLKRRLAQAFDIFNLDEYNTSKLNHKTEEESENLYLWVKNRNYEEPDIKKINKVEPDKIKINKVEPNNVETSNHKKEQNKKYLFKKIHSILTYKMENNRLGCINRDLNSVYNMKKLVNYWFTNKERPINYTRKKEKENNVQSYK